MPLPQAESLPQDASIDWVDIASDFIPIYGDIKSFAEAQTGLDYAIATAGVFLKPVKAIKAADKVSDAVDAAKKVGKKAANSSKNEAHGDAGRAMEKAKKANEKLQQKLNQSGLSRAERKQIEQKMKNNIRDAQKKEKGENHSMKGK